MAQNYTQPEPREKVLDRIWELLHEGLTVQQVVDRMVAGGYDRGWAEHWVAAVNDPPGYDPEFLSF